MTNLAQNYATRTDILCRKLEVFRDNLRGELHAAYRDVFQRDVGAFILKLREVETPATITEVGGWRGRSGQAQAIQGEVSAWRLQMLRDQFPAVPFPDSEARNTEAFRRTVVYVRQWDPCPAVMKLDSLSIRLLKEVLAKEYLFRDAIQYMENVSLQDAKTLSSISGGARFQTECHALLKRLVNNRGSRPGNSPLLSSDCLSLVLDWGPSTTAAMEVLADRRTWSCQS